MVDRLVSTTISIVDEHNMRFARISISKTSMNCMFRSHGVQEEHRRGGPKIRMPAATRSNRTTGVSVVGLCQSTSHSDTNACRYPRISRGQVNRVLKDTKRGDPKFPPRYGGYDSSLRLHESGTRENECHRCDESVA